MIKKKILMSRSMVPNSVFYYTILLIDFFFKYLKFPDVEILEYL